MKKSWIILLLFLAGCQQNNNTNNNKNETYTGQLTTGSDAYFDREAYSS